MKIGDLVRLKSGGPVMTVDFVRQPKESDYPVTADCVWFELLASSAGLLSGATISFGPNYGVRREAEFSVDALEAVG